MKIYMVHLSCLYIMGVFLITSCNCNSVKGSSLTTSEGKEIAPMNVTTELTDILPDNLIALLIDNTLDKCINKNITVKSNNKDFSCNDDGLFKYLQQTGLKHILLIFNEKAGANELDTFINKSIRFAYDNKIDLYAYFPVSKITSGKYTHYIFTE